MLYTRKGSLRDANVLEHSYFFSAFKIETDQTKLYILYCVPKTAFKAQFLICQTRNDYRTPRGRYDKSDFSKRNSTIISF